MLSDARPSGNCEPFGQPPRVSSVEALTDPTVLSHVLAYAVEKLRVEPLQGVGYSNASFRRVEVEGPGGEHASFVLKRTRLDEDWTACRTGDEKGREALLLSERALAAVWEVFDCPYVAFAAEPGEIGLLLRDLTPELLPDARVPLSDPQEDALLGALARLHARFWDRRAPAVEWLVRPSQYCELLAPAVAADPAALAMLSAPLRDPVPRGWASALSRLSPVVAHRLSCPGVEWERTWTDLPRTLLHGDVKVANFALGADGRVAAFDWALAGTGPCAIDVGWYLAVNASRLTGSKEKMLLQYRVLLESALGWRLPERMWVTLEDVAVVSGARMLLWSKALALESARPGAPEEWDWWVSRLEAVGLQG
jgi:hypothetical protein